MTLRSVRYVQPLLIILVLLSGCSSSSHLNTDIQSAPTNTAPAGLPLAEPAADAGAPEMDDTAADEIADPLEPWNRAMFTFNDRLYFWAMKPFLKGYNWVIPEPARRSIRNFFLNIEMPTRFVCSVLQAEIKAAGVELARFGINTTLGVAGLFDVAKNSFDMQPQTKDIGQTLGKYGIGEGFYIVWPFLGPSTARDTIGTAGEIYFSPWMFIKPWEAAAAVGAFDYINKNSLDSSDYEELVSMAVEPYAALKNAFVQYRRDIIKNK